MCDLDTARTSIASTGLEPGRLVKFLRCRIGRMRAARCAVGNFERCPCTRWHCGRHRPAHAAGRAQGVLSRDGRVAVREPEVAGPGWTSWDMTRKLHRSDQGHSETTDATRTDRGFRAAKNEEMAGQ